MSSEKKGSGRYFGGERVNAPVCALEAQTFSELVAEKVRKPVQLKITKAQFGKMAKADRNKAKEVPYLVAATFREAQSQRRTDEALSCNLIILDLDEEKDGGCPAAKFVQDEDSLAKALAPFAFAAYTTASSTPNKPRMRVIVSASKIPLSRYAEAVQYLGIRMGLKTVTAESKTPVQPMFRPTIFSDECDILNNPLIVEKPGRAFSVADLPTQTEVDEDENVDGDALQNLRPRDPKFTLAVAENAIESIDPDLAYPEWIKIAAALKHQFSPEHDQKAYQLFDEWSAKGTKYQDEAETRLKWDSLKQTPGGRAPVTIGTLIKMAEAEGWKMMKQAELAKGKEDIVIPNFRGCLIHASELETMDIPRRARLLDHWLCEGDLGYIFAARGVGKTWMSMGMLGAISQQEELGAWTAGEKRCKVLYVDGEMPMELTQSRSRSLAMRRGDVLFLHHQRVFDKMDTNLDIGRDSHRTGITNLITTEGFGVLVLDNLSALAFGVDENKGEEYEPLKCWLLNLRRRKVTVIVIHHAGKSGLMRGHSKREDDCSWILELKDAKNEGENGAKFVSHFAKPSRNTGDSLPDLLWHITTKEDEVSIMCEEAAASEYQQFICHVRDGVERQKEIAELMQKPEGTISKWARRAMADGHIRKEGQKLIAVAKAKAADVLDDL